LLFFFFQAEDGIRDFHVTGVQTCALPICLLIGSGSVTAVAAMITATSGDIWGILTAVVATLVLLLRARTYANGSQAVALLTTGMASAAGILLGWMWTEEANDRVLWVFGTILLLGAAALVLGVLFPNQRFTPPMRRAVEIFEAACIAAVLPLALAVMGLYSTLRHLDIG